MDIDKSYPCSKEIYNKCENRKIEYIVIHFTGDGGVPAKNYAKCNQFNNAHREASWHYCIGDKTENYKIYQSVDDMSISWHCGAKTYKHPKCRNNNSIGIEHCCYWKNGKAYFEDGTIEASVELVVYLMKKYNIPISNVIRHFDVTGKSCPQPFLYNDGQWERYLEKIKSKLNNSNNTSSDEKLLKAVLKIIKSGIQLDNSWTNLNSINIKNTKALVYKLGGIEKLVSMGVISDKLLWTKNINKVTPNNIASLLIKYASKL